jgi:hypothetical protein
MPRINKRGTIKVALKSIAGGEVEVYTSLTAGDVERIYASQTKTLLTPLVLLIAKWNLTDEKDVPLAINETNVERLDINDVTEIMDKSGVGVTDFLERKGKTPEKKTG